ncbi:ABC transporter permease [Natrialba sp. SSL1]|uniref:ABC transporter permease n=1 Tax=Natrialba sp. SSL1 TaxID=1869245 RepID=UPI0008F94FD6|nr:ABC transporter permease [Natrialba sp. SSL1]OIB58952.1 ABC transporter [Natrialba sp. SSL1]
MIFRNLPVPTSVRERVTPRHLVAFGLGWLALFFVLPILVLVWQSLGIGTGEPLSAYQQALSGLYLWTIVRSFYYGIATTIVTLALAYAFSYFVVFWTSMKNLFLILVVLPLWIAYIIRYLGIQLFFSPTGPFVDLFGTDFGFLFSTRGVILGMTIAYLPFAILPIYNSMNAIDRDHIHASRVLGAGSLRTVYSVVFPLSLSGIVAAGLIVFILSSGSFLAPAVLGSSENFMIANMIERSYTELFNIELAAALSVIYTIILLALIAVFNSYVNLGEVFENI